MTIAGYEAPKTVEQNHDFARECAFCRYGKLSRRFRFQACPCERQSPHFQSSDDRRAGQFFQKVGGEAKPYQVWQFLREDWTMKHDYHINIFFSPEDAGYIADIPDLEACSAFG